MRRRGDFQFSVWGVLIAVLGCATATDEESPFVPNDGSGGSAGASVGGTLNTGGTGTGGTPSTGGTSTGGTLSTGGTSTGGTPSTGGTSTGGTPSTGGTGAGQGGVSGAGSAAGKGGTSPFGGTGGMSVSGAGGKAGSAGAGGGASGAASCRQRWKRRSRGDGWGRWRRRRGRHDGRVRRHGLRHLPTLAPTPAASGNIGTTAVCYEIDAPCCRLASVEPGLAHTDSQRHAAAMPPTLPAAVGGKYVIEFGAGIARVHVLELLALSVARAT